MGNINVVPHASSIFFFKILICIPVMRKVAVTSLDSFHMCFKNIQIFMQARIKDHTCINRSLFAGKTGIQIKHQNRYFVVTKNYVDFTKFLRRLFLRKFHKSFYVTNFMSRKFYCENSLTVFLFKIDFDITYFDFKTCEV